MHANAPSESEMAPTLPRDLAREVARTVVLVASPDAAKADAEAERLRRVGTVAYAAHSWQGALRVATAVGPRVVLVDPAFPSRLTSLLRAHPASAGATILSLSAAPSPATFQPRDASCPALLAAA